MRGHLVKRSEHSWSLVVDLGRDPSTGKRRQQRVSIRGTKREAEVKLSEMLHQLDTGGFVRPAKLTVGDFLRQWLRDYASTNVRPRTFEGYRNVVEVHLVPSLGAIPLTQLQPSHLQAYYADGLAHGRRDGRGEGLSARSVLGHHRILREALGHAVKWGMVARNVCDAVDPPRPRQKQMQALDAAGVHALLEAARETMWYHPLHLDVYTGLRRSELLGLRWKDVDLDMATLSVVQVMHHLRDGRTVFMEPKTAKGKRLVALSPTATLALRAHRETQEADRAMLGLALTGDSLVFAQPDGLPILPDSLTRAFVRLSRKVGLAGVRLHDLRHTHASLMLRQGVHPKIVSERLGHASIQITLDTYSHVTPGLQAQAALRFDQGLSQAAPVGVPVSSR